MSTKYSNQGPHFLHNVAKLCTLSKRYKREVNSYNICCVQELSKEKTNTRSLGKKASADGVVVSFSLSESTSTE